MAPRAFVIDGEHRCRIQKIKRAGESRGVWLYFIYTTGEIARAHGQWDEYREEGTPFLED